MVCVAATPATKPLFPGGTTKPATQPASAPARVRDGLLGGSVRFLVPSQWRLFDRKEDQTQVFYHPSPEVGTVSVMVTPPGPSDCVISSSWTSPTQGCDGGR